MERKLSRANTSALSDDPIEANATSNMSGRPASSPVPRHSQFDVDSDHLSDDVIEDDRVLAIGQLDDHDSTEDEENNSLDMNHKGNKRSVLKTNGHQLNSKLNTQPSASSTISSNSAKSLALPPLTNEQLTKSRFMLGSTTFFVSTMYMQSDLRLCLCQ